MLALLFAFCVLVDDPNWFLPNFNFSRPSAAYATDPLTMQSADADTPFRRTVVACSISDGAYYTGEGVGGSEVVPLCHNSRFIFGWGGGRVYRSTDGFHWESLSGISCITMFALADDSLLTYYFDENGRLTASRSADDSASWERVKWADTGENLAYLTPGASITPFGLWQAANGTIIAVEYRLPQGGRYIYRSVDSGRTWRVVGDNQGLVTHFHAVTKHEGLGRWITDTGDGAARQELLASDDDGQTWYNYSQLGQVYAQPTFLMDVGDPQRLLFGSDLAWQAGWLDISDGPGARTLHSVITNWNHTVSKDLCFLMFQHAGLTYACNYEDSPYGRLNVIISVSADLEHWAIYHRFINNERGPIKFAGYAGGKLHLEVLENDETPRHFAFSPATIALTRATTISPGGQNLLTNPGDEDCERLDNWLNLSPPAGNGDIGLLEVNSNHPQQGLGSIGFSRADGLGMIIASPPIPVALGETYQARFCVRGDAAVVQFNWWSEGDQLDDGLNAVRFCPNSDFWIEVISPPLTDSEGIDELRLSFSADPHPFSGKCEFFVDSLQIETRLSTPWLPAGETRAPAARTAVVPNAETFAHVFTVEPDTISEYWTHAGTLTLASYYFDADDQIELAFNGDSATFEISGVVHGAPLPLLRTAAQHFQQHAHVRLGVLASTDHLTLAVGNGQPLEIASIALAAPLPPGAMTIRHAGMGGHNVFPGAYFGEACTTPGPSLSSLAEMMGNIASLGAPPVLTSQPAPQTICEGAPAILSISATNTAAPDIHWRKNGVAIPGAKGASLLFAAATTDDAGSYDCVVDTDFGFLTSDAAPLVVNEITSVLVPPDDLTICEGDPALLSLTARGTNLTYQWSKDGIPIPGAVENALLIEAATASQAGQYQCDVSGECGTQPATAVLTVNPVTAIFENPVDQTVNVGEPADFTIAAVGSELSFQWRHDGVAIPGATSNSYHIAAAELADQGAYDCAIAGTCGSLTSTAASLTISPSARVKLSSVGNCPAPGSILVVDVNMNAANAQIVGGQFFVAYDRMHLSFLGAAPGDAPFTVPIYETSDPVAGTLDYAIGIPFPGGTGVSGQRTLARLSFTVLAGDDCNAAGLVTFRPHNPSSQLIDSDDRQISTSRGNLDVTNLNAIAIDGTPPAVTPPPDISASVNIGNPYAHLSIGQATAIDVCAGPVPTSATRDDGLALDDAYPFGTTTILWSAQDNCGNTGTSLQHVNVAYATSALLALNTTAGCYPTDTVLRVDIDMNAADTLIVGGQFFLAYDRSRLAFVSIEPGDPAFTVSIHQFVDPAAGTLDYAVGIPFVGSAGVDGAHTLARAYFMVIADDDGCSAPELVAFRNHNPPSRLTDSLDRELSLAFGNLDLLRLNTVRLDGTPPLVIAPPDQTVTAAPGELTALVSVGQATAQDLCDGPLPATGARSDAAPLNAPYPLGLTSILWQAQDSCGNIGGAFQSVTVNSSRPPCPGDLNDDRHVDLSDLAQLLAHYGLYGTATYHDGDLNGDHNVDLGDLAMLLSVFGLNCP